MYRVAHFRCGREREFFQNCGSINDEGRGGGGGEGKFTIWMVRRIVAQIYVVFG